MPTKRLPRGAFCFLADIKLAAPAGEDKRRKFSGTAYSGEAILGHGYWGKVAFDLSSTKAEQRMPALISHDFEQIAGYTESVDIGSTVEVAGLLSNVTEAGKYVAGLSDEGFPWQMSMYIRPQSVEEVKDGAEISVNGRRFTGPGFVFRNAAIREVSFTPLGADDKTRAAALADGDEISIELKESDMPPTTPDPKDVATLQSQVQDLTARLAEATKAATDSQAALAALQKQIADGAAAERLAAVKEMFAASGREFSETAAAPYLGMTKEQFAAVSADMKAVRAAIPDHLFSEQAKEGKAGGEPKSVLLTTVQRLYPPKPAAA